MPRAMPSREDLRVGDEQVVAHQLHLAPELLREQRPAVPVALRHAVLDGDDRVLVDEAGEVVDELRRRELAALGLEVVHAVLEELGARDVEAEVHVLARPCSRRA